MRIRFDIDFDEGCYPGPLGKSPAVIDEAWLGLRGFREVLETQLGLTGAYRSEPERALQLVHAIRSTSGFWSASAENDIFGTATKLLAWRDELWLGGWRGKGTGGRLGALAKLCAALAPGVPDRLDAIAEVLPRRAPDIERVTLLEPEAHLSLSWRRILAALRARGVAVEHEALAPAPAEGDLAACRAGGFKPACDGSLQLLRASGQSETAEEAAAWLSTVPTGSSVAVIWPDPVLDCALHRHGLATLGASSDLQPHALLSVLPLLLDLGWDPPDPRVAWELCMLPAGPVPPGTASRLAGALQSWPAVGSDDWREALGSLEGRAAARVEAIFRPAVPRHKRYPAAELRRRVKLCQQWAQRHKPKHPQHAAACDDVLRQCSVLTGMVDACGLDDFSPLELGFLTAQATHPVSSATTCPAEAGPVMLGAPGAVTGPVDFVLFWDFSMSRFERPAGIPLSSAEHRELDAAGVELVDPAEKALRQAARWMRPFELARRGVLCACPLRTREGEEEFPHPAWDLIRSRTAEDTASLLEVTAPMHPPARQAQTPKPTVQTAARFSIEPGSVAPRELESPTSLEKLLRCPLAYLLRYPAGLRPGTGPPPTVDNPLLLGNLVHHLLAEVLEQARTGKLESPDRGAEEIEAVFDRLVPRMAAVFYLPGNEDARARLRLRLGRAVRTLLRMIEAGGYRVAGPEHPLAIDALGIRVGGNLDLLLDAPEAVVDFKWSRTSHRRSQLEGGGALQLAVYSQLARDRRKKHHPPVAFHIVSTNQLLTNDPKAFPEATVVRGPGPADTWAALERAFETIWNEIRSGAVTAAGLAETPPRADRIVEDRLQLAPQCEYCDHQALCGLLFGEV